MADKRFESRRGFTLVELLVVIAIIRHPVRSPTGRPVGGEAARRNQCRTTSSRSDWRRINYDAGHRVFPPGFLGSTGPINLVR